MNDAEILFDQGSSNVRTVAYGGILLTRQKGKPMEMLKVAKNCIIPKENVNIITDYKSRSIWSHVREKKERGECYNMAGKEKINAVIFLKSGEIITTNTQLDTLSSRMEKKEGE